MGFLLVGGAGYLILVLSRNASLSYFAIYLASAGIFPLIPNTIAILSGNTEGSYKRAVTVGIAISWGNLNGAVASNIYRADQRVRLFPVSTPPTITLTFTTFNLFLHDPVLRQC